MHLFVEYSRITNQTLHSCLSTVQTFWWWMSAAHSIFKQNVQNVHQLQQHTGLLLPAQCITAKPVSSTRRQVMCNVLKLQFMSGLTCSYRFSPKSLLAKHLNMQFDFIAQFLFCSLAILDPRVGHTMDVLSLFISTSVILIDPPTGSSVHVLILSIQALTCILTIIFVHHVQKKGSTILLLLTLPNADRFSKLVYRYI